MLKRLLLGASICLYASGAHAAPFVFATHMSGPNENPPIPSLGTGFAEVIYDSVLQTLQVSTTFSNLTGTTTVAHIHCCVDPPGTVGVATFPGTFPGFPVGVTAGSYVGSWDLTQTTSYTAGFLAASGGTASGAEAALFQGMMNGRAYVNIHTSFAGGGEIRGFLAPVPEPATLSLVALGAGAIAAGHRRRRARRHL
jgi:hypothetical protein